MSANQRVMTSFKPLLCTDVEPTKTNLLHRNKFLSSTDQNLEEAQEVKMQSEKYRTYSWKYVIKKKTYGTVSERKSNSVNIQISSQTNF